MAVAFSSATLSSQYFNTTGYSFAYSQAGNAICILSYSDSYTTGTPASPTIQYGAGTCTKTFTIDTISWNTVRFDGYYLLNAAASGTMTVSFGTNTQDVAFIEIISVSGASTSVAPTSNAVSVYQSGTNTLITTPVSITSAANNLVVGFASINGDGLCYYTAMNGTYASTPFWYNYLAGSSPTATVSATWFDSAITGGSDQLVAGFSFAPSGVTPTVIKTNQIIGPQVGVWTSSYLR